MIKRPQLVHFICIETKDNICVKISLTMAKRSLLTNKESNPKTDDLSNLIPSTPWKSLGLLSGTVFKIRIIGIDLEFQEVFNRVYESDAQGSFFIKISKPAKYNPPLRLQVFELSTYPGLSLLMGNFIPLKIHEPKKIIISDFDKTLVDTRYSTTRELYNSLTRPLQYFPKIEPSISLFKQFIADQFQPFILTASPHFYEEAIRDWLYQNHIYTAGIFLKDYRKVLSPLEGDLTTKDIKSQGFYKLNQLISILLMTGVPQELILMGDGFESDTNIYLALVALLTEDIEPWSLWNTIKKDECFRFTNLQNSRFLNKIYQLRSLMEQDSLQSKKRSFKIFIRCRIQNDKTRPSVHVQLLRKYLPLVEFYDA